jgi:hypothetical protein
MLVSARRNSQWSIVMPDEFEPIDDDEYFWWLMGGLKKRLHPQTADLKI